ncbi:MAG: energy transducer TonB [Saprospiraceae bacterium]
MKSLKIIFFFTAAIALGVSCKNDKTSQSEEKASPPFKEVKTNPNNSITAVEKLYRSNEVDTPALFSASCQQNENKAKCSQNILQDYIKNNLVIPNEAREKRHREVISFTILADGSIGKNIRSISKKEVCSGCRAAAITVLSRMPKWVPAMKEGKTVAMSMTIPITF